MKNRLLLVLLGATLLRAPFLLSVRAQENVTPASRPPLGAQLDALLAAPVLENASVGVVVRSLADNRVVYTRNPDLALIPASNQKILTAGAALARLGPAFRFRTFVFRTGRLDPNGTLQGDLILRGTGDPSLTSAHLAQFARAVRAVGIRRIEGRILADDGRFDDKRLGTGWQWDDEPWAYQPQVSALNCDGNVVSVRVAPGTRTGAPAIVTLDPPTRYVRVESSVTTGEADSKANVQFDRRRGQNVLLLRGTIPRGAGAPVANALTVEDPALLATTRLAEFLSAEGVERIGASAGPPRRAAPTPANATPIVERASAPLSELVRDFLKHSDNLYGEVLLKALGAECAGKGSGANGAGEQVVRSFLREAGVDAAPLVIADGSGLSRLNLVTPRALAGVLAHLAGRAAFTGALPVGGVDGTLRSRFRDTPAVGNVRAKTGTLSGVTSLSGYVTTRAGEPLVFAIMMNNYRPAGVGGGASAARAVQNALVLALIDMPRPQALSAP